MNVGLPSPSRRFRRAGILVAAIFVLSAAAPALGATIMPPLDQMLQTARLSQRIPVLMRMAQQPDEVDLELAAEGQTRAEQLRGLVAYLKNLAAVTQNSPTLAVHDGQLVFRPVGLLDELRAAGLKVWINTRPLWVTNAVVTVATPDIIRGCADRLDVGEIMYAGPAQSAGPRAAPPDPQWNVTRVRAPEVWALGFRGAGTLVAAIDTGASTVSPVLAANVLRDTNGDAIWHDAVKRRPIPYDDHGHGSHVLGVAVGADGIGVAPDAHWIACKAFRRGRLGTIAATAAQILECGQWVLNPDEPAEPDPAHVPNVVLNAWWVGAPGACDPIFQPMLRVWRAARILPVFAVGDAPDGVTADGVPVPASYPEAFSVGATDEADQVTPSSFRGLADCGAAAVPAPRVLAPGVDITSATKGVVLGVQSGTGPAAAHAAGAAALLWNAHPALTVDQVDAVLQRSARGFVAAPVYQPGLLDAFAAVTFEDARFVSEVAPTGTLRTGERIPVSVTMRNTGVTTWHRGVHRLAAINGTAGIWGIDRVDLPVGTDVSPGGLRTFTFDVIAPPVPNLAPGYAFQWQMVHEGGAFFGEPTPADVRVPVRGFNDATFVEQRYNGQTAVPTLTPSQCIPVSVTFRNTGTNAWTSASGYRLGSQNPQDSTTWSVNRVDLASTEVVAPGAQKTFSFTACAPAIQGNYNFQWRMVQDGVAWFGQFGRSDTVPVAGVDDAAQPAGVWPGELRVGQAFDAIVGMQNAGTNAWIGGYCLTALQGGFWGPSSVCLQAGEVVLPGQRRDFSFRITGPNSPGRWDFSYQMANDAGRRFGTPFATTIDVPLDFQASACWSATQGACGWVFRHYDSGAQLYRKMTWAGDHWQGPGPQQKIFSNSAHPGTDPVARFWKSPFPGTVTIRISGEVHDLDGGCGDGVRFRLRKNTANPLQEIIVLNGDGAPHAFGAQFSVVQSDSVRLIIGNRSTSTCDSTFLDPLIQVLPSGMGAIVPGAVIDPDVEPGDGG